MTVDINALRALLRAVEDTEHDLNSMPFFVRPMAKKGLASRTGLDLDGWSSLALDMVRRAEAGADASELLAVRSDLQGRLEALADNYATAPERAAKGMGRIPSVLERIKKSSAEREAAVRGVIGALFDDAG
jgi:hypothetical protein